jgi:hypothetical protein
VRFPRATRPIGLAQIIFTIRDGLINLDVSGTAMHRVDGQFAAANPAFIDLTYQRTASYWDCYYRNLFADRRNYPSFPILASIRAAGADLNAVVPRPQP